MFAMSYTETVAAFAIALLFAGSATAADGWRAYVYPGLKFAVSFALPQKSKTAMTRWPTEAASKHGSTRWSWTTIPPHDRGDFSRPGWDEFAVLAKLDQAVKSPLQDAELNLRYRFNLIYTCREMSLVRRDGSHAAAAAMFHQDKLYQIEGTVLPSNADPEAGDTIRFQHSLRFTDFAHQ